MKNFFLQFYFVFSLIIGTLIYIAQKNGIQIPNFINFYVNDFLIIPIILFISLQILKWSKNNKRYTISLPVILYLCFMFSLLFEFVLPNYLARYTKDYIDVILYFTSGLIFYGLQKKNN